MKKTIGDIMPSSPLEENYLVVPEKIRIFAP